MQKPLTVEMAQRVVDFELSRDDTALVAAARTAIIDTLGVTLLGAHAPCTRIAAQTLLGAGSGPATLAGRDTSTSVLDAALVNGVASHAMDFDDFTQDFGGHPSVPIVPGLMALAERERASGFAIMQAYVAGVELETRLARGVHFEHYEKGWHPTATLGVFGAAAAAAKLLGLDTRQTAMALAIAASLASGLKANFGTMTKPMHVGQCARNAVQAALLAQAGFDANIEVMEHPQGFLSVYNGPGQFRVSRILEPWFEPSVILNPGISLKQFACCGSVHPAIYMALELRRRGVRGSEVSRLSVRTHERRLPHTDNPQPSNGLEAKFSMHYCVARALVSGEPRLGDFTDEALSDPQVQALMTRIDVGADEQMSRDASHAFGAEVIAELHGGASERAFTRHMPGRGAANPMSEDELYRKFADCASAALSQSRMQALWSKLRRFEAMDNVHGLLAESANGSAAVA